ncbi:MAG: polysaccharide biosynthesis/export family protein [Bacteroidota bacterium]
MISAMLLISSCVSLNKVKYIQDVADYQKDSKIEFKNESSPDYIIQPGDNLYVDVSSLDSKNLNPFDANQRVNYQSNNEMSVYLNSYMVSDSGFIVFPVVGKILVAGLSVNSVKAKIQASINDFFQLTTVTVKLVNFKISLLGEVAKPGTYLVYQENINILQAISMAGDLLPYANRSKITIIRKAGRGASVHTVNLLKAGIFESPSYYLQPDDIVYVEPLNSKNYAFTAFPYAIIFSTITTTLLLLSYFK